MIKKIWNIWAALLTVVFFASAAVVTNYAAYFQLFEELFERIDSDFVDEVEKDQLLYVGMKAVASSLDPFSNFYDAAETEERKKKWSGVLKVGVGVDIFSRSDLPVVYGVDQRSPAEAADIRIGDIILELNGVSTKGVPLDSARAWLKGELNSTVSLKLQRPMVGHIERELVREEIANVVVPYYGMIDDSIGYVKMRHFYGKAGLAVRRAVNGLLANPAVKGVVMDMRDNSGGSVRQAVDMASVFLPEGDLVYYRQGKKGRKDYVTSKEPSDLDMPLVFLSNSSTASAAELVLAAMQDYDRGVIMGQESYGKALVQSTYYLGDTTSIYFTTSRYHSPSGRCLQKLDYRNTYKGQKAKPYAEEEKQDHRTTTQRLVRDYEAVQPDVELPEKERIDFLRYLGKSLPVFDWCNSYRNTIEAELGARQFAISEDDFSDFISFAERGGFDFRIKGTKELSKLEASLEGDGAGPEFSKVIASLEKRLNHRKKALLYDYKNEIMDLLADQIVKRYYGGEGKYERRLETHPEIAEAHKLLLNNSRYERLLNRP
ncbi:S41 family peptidase [Chitinophagales bacterium]|nr:S41 family peptidase [Chitinophagales bacterium]